MKKSISVLGSTGSVGVQTLCVAKELNIKVNALSCKSNIKLLEDQIREFNPKIASVESEKAAKDLKRNVKDLPVKVVAGLDGLCEVAAYNKSEILVNSVIGMVGLLPTLCAIENGIDIALANKETLVVGGDLVIKKAAAKGVNILPVDSEHSAIFQCLRGCHSKSNLEKIILTSSGGPFFGKTKSDLINVTKREALKHPNWEMGAKITIDSATMMNKGLEIIEAKWLFDVNPEKIEVVIHRESIVHSLIEYVDHSVIAQLGMPTMKIPIQYALTFPDRLHSSARKLRLSEVGKLSFFKPDYETFDCLNVCMEAIKKGGTYPAVINGANEQAVDLFLRDKISFLDIPKLVRKSMENFESTQKEEICLEDILSADKWGRNFVVNTVGKE